MVRLNRIYTRTGDDGTTGLVDGSRTPKDALRMQAIGDVDEANSLIGAAAALIDADRAASLLRIQNDLFDLGADLATPIEEVESEYALRIVPAQIEWLEREIDRLNADLPALTSFILPGGDAAVAALHVARATVRRAERSAVAAAREARLNPQALAYLNRLSDLLFVLARAIAVGGVGELLWRPAANR